MLCKKLNCVYMVVKHVLMGTEREAVLQRTEIRVRREVDMVCHCMIE